MATVGLTAYVKNCITQQVESVFVKRQGAYPPFPEAAPLGVGDEAFSLILPAENEKAFMELVPDWMFTKIHGMYIDISNQPQSPGYYRHAYIFAPFKEPHVNVYGEGTIRNVPGIDTAVWRDGTMVITLATDGSTIKQPALRDFMANLVDITATHHNMRDKVEKAKKDMETFLSQHRTLQKAVKAFGPSLMEYVPEHLKITYNRPPVKRTVREKVEPIVVDTDYLVAAATSHKLGLN